MSKHVITVLIAVSAALLVVGINNRYALPLLATKKQIDAAK
jgi:hypothetical protein